MSHANSLHRAVMVEKAMLVLDVKPGGIYVDGTLGGGTHSRELLQRSAPDGRVISLDVDPVSLERMRNNLDVSVRERWQGAEENFRYLDRVVDNLGLDSVNGVLLDLGLSSDELADPGRGLSFMTDGPLDMRLGEKSNSDGLTAADIINSWTQADIVRVLQVFGEERHALRIARAIIKARKQESLVRVSQLVDLITANVPIIYTREHLHPATRTFQALRIAVNDELEALSEAINAATRVLAHDGVLAIISFHSLEDRIVKQAFQTPLWSVLTPKPLMPGERELSDNPRSRSAKLRAAKFL